MTFDEYQEAARQTSGTSNTDTIYEGVSCAVLGLAGESGEVVDLIKKWAFHGHSLPTHKMREELGDVLWYLSDICSLLGYSLEAIARQNIAKLQRRYPDGFSSERSINRDQEPKGLTRYSGFVADKVFGVDPCPVCNVVGGHNFSCTNKGY